MVVESKNEDIQLYVLSAQYSLFAVCFVCFGFTINKWDIIYHAYMLRNDRHIKAIHLIKNICNQSLVHKKAAWKRRLTLPWNSSGTNLPSCDSCRLGLTVSTQSGLAQCQPNCALHSVSRIGPCTVSAELGLAQCQPNWALHSVNPIMPCRVSAQLGLAQ